VSARVSLHCDGTAPQGFPCARFKVWPGLAIKDARRQGRTEGWSTTRIGGRDIDACPACTARLRESAVAS
jgi:hypothetical protein